MDNRLALRHLPPMSSKLVPHAGTVSWQQQIALSFQCHHTIRALPSIRRCSDAVLLHYTQALEVRMTKTTMTRLPNLSKT